MSSEFIKETMPRVEMFPTTDRIGNWRLLRSSFLHEQLGGDCLVIGHIT